MTIALLRMWHMTWLAALLLACGAAGSTTAAAQVAVTAITPAMPCGGLRAVDLSTVPDAATHVTSAIPVDAAAGQPAYCEVEGYVAPQVGILMRLPTQGWNGKFLEVGCGGFCGVFTFIRDCDAPLRRGYACITTDMGHKGLEVEGVEWAYNNPQAVIDFGYRATHVTALAGKAIVERFYGRRPDRSYFSGCSCGGRQALVEAERFPDDFNGIIVGAPGISYSEFTLGFALRARRLQVDSGKPLFDPAAIQFIGRAIVAQCDMNDGLRDGQIGDPRLCRFNPRAHICRSGAAADCLTQEQADAALSFYRATRSASGDRLGDRAFLPGWEGSYLGMGDAPVLKRRFYEDYFKYMALVPNPGPAWRFEDFDLDRDPKRMGMIDALIGADNPDLSRFKAAGGKLIFYHGWADGGLSPLTSIDFYQRIERTMGGRATTQDFLRLFMVPDMDHCAGGKGPWAVDYLSYLDDWVERGRAPDVMVGAHHSDDPSFRAADGTSPQFTRPIYPYPLRARYKGRGDPNSAASFKPVGGDTTTSISTRGQS